VRATLFRGRHTPLSPVKIYSWNLNGYRAAAKKGFLEWFKKTDPDVLSLQEIRADWGELSNEDRAALTERHEVCWFPSTAKRGYAGSATIVRKGLPFEHRAGVGVAEFDDEGRLVVSKHPAFTLIAGYFPNASEELARLPYKRRFSRWIRDEVARRHAAGERVIVVGDLNVAPEEIDIARPASNRRSPGFTDEEREDFREYLRAGMSDVFRERNPSAKDQYTWWTWRANARERNVGWRLDIFLVSRALEPSVATVKHHTKVLGSDHCPISLELEL
jgi:exodeoxyribonuclease-3